MFITTPTSTHNRYILLITVHQVVRYDIIYSNDGNKFELGQNQVESRTLIVNLGLSFARLFLILDLFIILDFL